MKTRSSIVVILLLSAFAHLARATDADDTTITITGQTPGPTAFISQLTLNASDTTVINSIQFTISPKAGALAEPLSGTYSQDYLINKGYLVPPSTTIFLPVYGLYAGITNTVTLIYHFNDGSSKTASTAITTPTFDDEGCGYNTPTVLTPRSGDVSITYDYIFIRSGCGDYSPVILDTDGAVRWVSTMGVPNALTGASIFYKGAVYEGIDSVLYRVDLDGTVTMLKDYSASNDVTTFHHNIEVGKFGLMLEVDTTTQIESTLLEVDLSGNVLKTFSMADIISAAMVAGGDDPSQFVYPPPDDWFHNNASSYNRIDDSLIVSSRENFVIAIDYETTKIKWILGDHTKKWYEFPSLAAFALNYNPGSLPPVGQHAISLTYDEDVLLFDDGLGSMFQMPPGISRTYSSPRKYQLNLSEVTGASSPGTATVVWNYEQNQTIYSPICSSVYEDAPNNYLIDYAVAGGLGINPQLAQLLGVNAAGQQAFYYQYNTVVCDTAYNSLPIHLENTQFPVLGPQAINFSTRGQVSNSDNTLIGGFIVTGTGNKSVALRVLGPSLSNSGVTGVLANPVLTLYDSTGAVVAMNDDWANDPAAATLTADGLAPTNSLEAATVQSLAPGTYTVTATSSDGSLGIGLLEVYDLAPGSGSLLANISTRGLVGTGEDALISGFIVGEEASASVIVRALGPSLSNAGITNPLANPLLTIYDSTGTAIASNDDWQTSVGELDVVKNGLAPASDVESALTLHPPAGSYTAIVTGAGGGTGVALLEVYDLDQPSS